MRNKYNSNKITIEDEGKTLKFDSETEMRRYYVLKEQQIQKYISDLQTQVPFKFELNGYTICRYVADFVYLDINGEKVIEDVKGFITDVYSLKEKMMYAFYGIRIKRLFYSKKGGWFVQQKRRRSLQLDS